jgi:hypothetical protein
MLSAVVLASAARAIAQLAPNAAVQWVPALVRTARTYTNLMELLDEIGNARVWAGLHWRQSIRDGVQIGARVAAHVQATQFRPAR